MQSSIYQEDDSGNAVSVNYREKSEDHLRTLGWSQCKTMQIQTSTTAVKRKTEPCEDILMGLENHRNLEGKGTTDKDLMSPA